MVLKEYQFLQYKDETGDHYIEKQIFEELESFVLENEETSQFLKLKTKKGYGKVLQAQNYVGVIQTKDGSTIEILPKIVNIKGNTEKEQNEESRKVLIKMLKTLKNSPFKSLNMAHLRNTKLPLFEIFISMFLEELSILVRKGIRSDYINKEDNLRFLKGKLKINEQIKYNYIHKERFFVSYDEYSSNRVENRLIKTTLQYLYKKSKSHKNQQRIREFMFIFDEVDVSRNVKTDFTKVKNNRQMKAYGQVMLWCKTFLLGESFSPYKGNSVAFALLFDMNRLFESYVYDYLRRYGGYDSITAQDKGKYLAYLNGNDAKFKLKPDIVINKDSDNVIIADTKWKILSEEKTHQGISQSDMYQLFAYGNKYRNCKEMYLIFPLDAISQNDGNYYRYYEGRPKKELNLQILFFDVTDQRKNHFKLEKSYEHK